MKDKAFLFEDGCVLGLLSKSSCYEDILDNGELEIVCKLNSLNEPSLEVTAITDPANLNMDGIEKKVYLRKG